MAETEAEKKAREAKEAEKAEEARKEKLRLAEEAMHKRKGTGFPW